MRLNRKKIVFGSLLFLFTVGSAITVAIFPATGATMLVSSVVFSALAGAFALVYDWEIFKQNIQSAFNKLFAKRQPLKRRLSNEFMLEALLSAKDNEELPSIVDYYKKVCLRYQYVLATGKGESEKKKLHKELRDLEKWFSAQIFSKIDPKEMTSAQSEFNKWLNENPCFSQVKLDYRRIKLNDFFVKILSVLTTIVSGFGTYFLLASQISAISFFALLSPTSLALIVIPLSLIAGIGAGFVAYNVYTEIVHHGAANRWFDAIKEDLSSTTAQLKSEEKPVSGKAWLAFSALMLVILSTVFTGLTVGTWFAVLHVGGFSTIPALVMAMIAGLSNWAFNIENAADTYRLFKKKLEQSSNEEISYVDRLTRIWNQLRQRGENTVQILNLPRLIIVILFPLLRIVLFQGHTLSTALTSDRAPGVPPFLSIVVGMFFGNWIDANYFMGNTPGLLDNQLAEPKTKSPNPEKVFRERLQSGHFHSHNDDAPTILLKGAFFPLRVLAMGWDLLFSQMNSGPARLSIYDAIDKYFGKKPPVSYNNVPSAVAAPAAWSYEHGILLLNRDLHDMKKVTFAKEKAELRKQGLTTLRNEFIQEAKTDSTEVSSELKAKLAAAASDDKTYNKHRIFPVLQSCLGATKTAKNLQEMPARIFSV